MKVSFDKQGIPSYENAGYNRFVLAAVMAGRIPEHYTDTIDGIPYFGPMVRCVRTNIQATTDALKLPVKWKEIAHDAYVLLPSGK